MAGLAGSGDMVGVGPPLSCTGPSSGSMGEPAEPIWSPNPVHPMLFPALPIRLYPCEMNAPEVSGFIGAVLPAMMVLRIGMELPAATTPPPNWEALLPATVLL